MVAVIKTIPRNIKAKTAVLLLNSQDHDLFIMGSFSLIRSPFLSLLLATKKAAQMRQRIMQEMIFNLIQD